MLFAPSEQTPCIAKDPKHAQSNIDMLPPEVKNLGSHKMQIKPYLKPNYNSGMTAVKHLTIKLYLPLRETTHVWRQSAK
jgi:hypothetical protein